MLAAGDGADLVLARLQFGHLVRCLLMRAVADAALPLIRVRERRKVNEGLAEPSSFIMARVRALAMEYPVVSAE